MKYLELADKSSVGVARLKERVLGSTTRGPNPGHKQPACPYSRVEVTVLMPLKGSKPGSKEEKKTTPLYKAKLSPVQPPKNLHLPDPARPGPLPPPRPMPQPINTRDRSMQQQIFNPGEYSKQYQTDEMQMPPPMPIQQTHPRPPMPPPQPPRPSFPPMPDSSMPQPTPMPIHSHQPPSPAPVPGPSPVPVPVPVPITHQQQQRRVQPPIFRPVARPPTNVIEEQKNVHPPPIVPPVGAQSATAPRPIYALGKERLLEQANFGINPFKQEVSDS